MGIFAKIAHRFAVTSVPIAHLISCQFRFYTFLAFHTIRTATHASPAAVYAHVACRSWETNTKVRASNCDDAIVDDIAEQLVYGETGRQLKVIFAGGRQNFLNQTTLDEDGNPGARTDGKNLIYEWLENGQDGEDRYYISNRVSRAFFPFNQ